MRWNGSTTHFAGGGGAGGGELAPAIPQIWRAEVQSLRADLRGWLQQQAAAEADWTPDSTNSVSA